MADLIRLIEEQDFDKASKLFIVQKNIEELKWLLQDYENKSKYNGYVAINSHNEIVGLIGFSYSIYKQNSNQLTGVIPMSWVIASKYKGIAGLLLFKKVSLLADFAIAIDGTEIAQKLYPLVKYKRVTHIDLYYKLTGFYKLFSSIQRSSLKMKIGMIGFLFPTYFKNYPKSKFDKALVFEEYNGVNFIEEKNYSNVFRKVITKNYIDWLLNCPTINAYAFCLKKDNEELGICILYIQKSKNGNKGRIVHLPYLGKNQNLWSSAIEKCLIFFKKEKCSYVTGLTNYENLHSAYLNSGFRKIQQHHKPVFIKDVNKRLDSIHIDQANLQFSEADIAYRGL